jgi:hypothetical protein
MRTLLWLLLVGVLLVVLGVVGAPVFLVQPFAPQTPDGLSWSWTLRRAAPTVTTVALGLSVLLASLLWRRPLRAAARHAGAAPTAPKRPGRLTRWWRGRFWYGWAWRTIGRRTLLSLLVLPVAATAWFARQNHFEWMFRPFPDPRFVSVDQAKDLKSFEPIIAVADRGESLAFPITRIGYHHLVNPALGGVPIVATY